MVNAANDGLIDCDRHGRGACAIVCRHHLATGGRAVGSAEPLQGNSVLHSLVTNANANCAEVNAA